MTFWRRDAPLTRVPSVRRCFLVRVTSWRSRQYVKAKIRLSRWGALNDLDGFGASARGVVIRSCLRAAGW
jgi:hypothetical protein